MDHTNFNAGTGRRRAPGTRFLSDNCIVRTSRLETNTRGIYEIRYTEPRPDGQGYRSRTFSTGHKDRTSAEQSLARWLSEAATRSNRTMVRRVTVEAICADYVMHKPEQAQPLRAVRDLLGALSPDDLGSVTMLNYRAMRTHVKDGTMRRELSALVAALNRAKRQGVVTTWPVIDLPPHSQPRVKFLENIRETHFRQEALHWGETPGAGQAGRQDVAVFVALALDTAARRGAILDLTWDRVDFERKVINYHVPGRRVSRKRRTSVPMAQLLVPVLRAAAQRAADKNPSGIPAGRVIKSGLYIAHLFREFTASINMAWVTPHVLRHTWATLAVLDGVHIKLIADMLGDTVATVEKTYMHIQPHHLAAAVDRVRR